MSIEFETQSKGKFFVNFPKEIGIEEWSVQTITLPKQTGNKLVYYGRR